MEPDPTPTAADTATATYLRRHLRFGWWSLLCFLTLGIVLESLHGFKVGWYLDAAHSTRRLMWTLAHAHGVLLSLVHLAFAATLPHLAADTLRLARLASPSLMGASFLLPGGFFLGGVVIHGGDPGSGDPARPRRRPFPVYRGPVDRLPGHGAEETGIAPGDGSSIARPPQAGRPATAALTLLLG